VAAPRRSNRDLAGFLRVGGAPGDRKLIRILADEIAVMFETGPNDNRCATLLMLTQFK